MNDLIKTNIKNIQENIQSHSKGTPPKLLVATKYATLEETQSIINAGCLLLGENKIQDAETKIHTLQNDSLTWHFIGHLQTNKVKKAIGLFDCIESIDSIKLAKALQKEAEVQGKTLPIFLQINAGEEENKYGFSFETIEEAFQTINELPNLRIKGIMIVTPLLEEIEGVREYFKKAKILFDKLSLQHPQLTELSMGMSRDYDIAAEEGATIVRVGRHVFKN